MSLALFHEAAARYPYNSTAGYDYKAWAKRIIYRKERGDRTLTLAQVKSAEDAMKQVVDNVIF